MTFEEFINNVFYEDKDGCFHTLDFTEKQWSYVFFMSWVKSNGYDTTLLDMNMRGGKQYMRRLYEEWIGEM